MREIERKERERLRIQDSKKRQQLEALREQQNELLQNSEVRFRAINLET